MDRNIRSRFSCQRPPPRPSRIVHYRTYLFTAYTYNIHRPHIPGYLTTHVGTRVQFIYRVNCVHNAAAAAAASAD